MYPNNQNETIEVYKLGQVNGFVAGVAVCTTVYAMYKLNKATIKDRLNRLFNNN